MRQRFWPKLRANLHRVPFAQDAAAAYFSLTDPATPTRTKAILTGALVYFILPADVIPDMILALGFADDAAVVLAAVNAVRDSLTPEHYARARAALGVAMPEEAAVPPPHPSP